MTDTDKMMIERYTIRQTQDGYVAVIDNARDGETFCLIDPDDIDMGGADCAFARAKDIAEMFNRVTNPDDRLREALFGLVQAVEMDAHANNGISGYTGARLADAKEALSPLPQGDT